MGIGNKMDQSDQDIGIYDHSRLDKYELRAQAGLDRRQQGIADSTLLSLLLAVWS